MSPSESQWETSINTLSQALFVEYGMFENTQLKAHFYLKIPNIAFARTRTQCYKSGVLQYMHQVR